MKRCREPTEHARWLSGTLLFLVLSLILLPSSRATGAAWVEPLNRRMLDIRHQIQNASIKFKNGVQSPMPSHPGVAEAPSQACCSNNVQHIKELIADLGMLIVQLDATFASEMNRQGQQAIRNMKGDLVQLIRANEAFDRASSRPAAEAGLRGLTQSFIQLREHADTLEVCCAQK